MKLNIKTTLTVLALILICSTTTSAQRSFTYLIDNTKYSFEETKYNDLFGDAFTEIIRENWAKNKDFPLWAQTFNDMKDYTVKGVWNYTTYGNRVSNYSFVGDIPQEYLGWRAPGKSAKGNPNKKDNLSKRMSIINTVLSRKVIYYFTKKEIIN